MISSLAVVCPKAGRLAKRIPWSINWPTAASYHCDLQFPHWFCIDGEAGKWSVHFARDSSTRIFPHLP